MALGLGKPLVFQYHSIADAASGTRRIVLGVSHDAVDREQGSLVAVGGGLVPVGRSLESTSLLASGVMVGGGTVTPI